MVRESFSSGYLITHQTITSSDCSKKNLRGFCKKWPLTQKRDTENQQISLSHKLHKPLKVYVEDLRRLIAEGSIFEQKSFLKSFIKRITVEGHRIVLTYTFPIKGGNGTSRAG